MRCTPQNPTWTRTSAPTRPGLHHRHLALPLLLTAMVVPPVLAQTEGEAVPMATMVVTGTALKVEAPLVETPRPASVVQREELEERNVQSLDETFRYRAGVLSGVYGADNDTNWFQVRGFDQSTYQDGLRIYREGYYQWLPEPFALERVELLKGPASILYGEAPPGGIINAISKRPAAEPQGQIEIQAGNRDHRQIGVDSSGPLTDDADVRYRVVGLYKERDGDLDHTNSERYYFAPSVEVDFSDATSLTVLASFQKDDAVPTNPFKLAYGTVLDTPYGKVDPQANFGEPDYDISDRTQSALGYELEHHFNDTWTARQKLRYSHLDLKLRSTYALRPNPDNDRETIRGLVYRDGQISSWTIDNQIVGKWFTERAENTLLIGFDYQDLENNGKEGDSFNFDQPLDMFDPQYGNFTPFDTNDLSRREIDKQQTGLYIQDQLRLDDRWVLLAGARYDQAETDNRTSTEVKRSDDEEVSLSGGIMYLFENGLSPYLSYSESFQPQAAVDDGGELLEPLKGEQWELGVKYAPQGFDGYVTAAVFDITETNPLVHNPGGATSQGVETTSRGFELESVGYLTPELQLTAAYTYNDVRTENTTTGTDDRAYLIPRHMASTWLDYTFSGALTGLKLGGGARYVGEIVDGDIEVDSYTLFDLMASYGFAGGWWAQLNVNNVGDKEYVASCAYGWCYSGESRSVIGSLSYRW